MNFGEILKKYRKEYGFAINEMGRKAKVSATYIRKLEQNIELVPSKKIVFNIILAFGGESLETPIAIQDDFLRAYNTDKDLDYNNSGDNIPEIWKEYNDYVENERIQTSNFYEDTRELIYENIMRVDNNYKIHADMEDINIPVYDLNWLLNQKKYKLMYGRSLKTNEQNGLMYNVINDEDKEIIRRLIDTYLKAKYERINEPKEFFDEIFNKLLDDNKLQKEFKVILNNNDKED